MMKTKNAPQDKQVDEALENGWQTGQGENGSEHVKTELVVETCTPCVLGEKKTGRRKAELRRRELDVLKDEDVTEDGTRAQEQEELVIDSRPPSKRKKRTRKRGRRRRKRCYYPGWKDIDSAEVQEGIRDFRFFTGVLRKNPKNLGDTAFVTTDDRRWASTDIFIPTLRYQNRALHLNRVLVELFDVKQWRNVLPGRTRALIDEVEYLSSQPWNRGVDLIAKAHSSSEVSCCSPSSSAQSWVPGEDRQNPICFQPDILKKQEEIGSNWNSHQPTNNQPMETTFQKLDNWEEDVSRSNDVERLSRKNDSCWDDLSGINADTEQMPPKEEKFGREISRQLKQSHRASRYGAPAGDTMHPFDSQDKQPTGRVIAAWESDDVDPERVEESKKHIGYIKRWRDRKLKNWYKFAPLDPTVPIAFLPRTEVPQDIKELSKKRRKYLYFEVRYLPWHKYQSLPCCEFIRLEGRRGDFDTETRALLHQNNITHTAEFSEKIKKEMVQLDQEFDIQREIEKRKDYRALNVFSIDPTNAKDLDDALSIETLESGNFRVGVHIADVTHFVKLSSETDKEARFRGTTVYLVQETIPMLPRILCESLCSLNEGEPRLAYSVFVVMDASGKVIDHVDFEKTVIENKCRMDYLQAQKILNGDYEVADLPQSIKLDENLRIAVVRDLKLCWKLAAKMRENRFENGALTLHRGKINIKLSEDNEPIGFQKYPIYDSNYLIEEFMLLANTLVAQKLIQAEEYSDFALLRKHPPPIDSVAQHLLALFRAKGWSVDISSSGAIERSLRKLEKTTVGNVTARQAVETLLIKTFRLAAYFIVGKSRDPDTWRHFALNLDAYTHFTSPIRRYADCVVHHQLTRILSKCSTTSDIHESSLTALRCNERKLAAKNASWRSQMVCFTMLLKQNPIIETAMIIDISNQRITFVIHKLGIEDSIELVDRGRLLHGVSCEVSGEPPFCSIQLFWKQHVPQTLRLFDEVNMQISANFKKSEVKPKYRILSGKSPWPNGYDKGIRTMEWEDPIKRFPCETHCSDGNLEVTGPKISESEVQMDTFREESNVIDDRVSDVGKEMVPETNFSEEP